MWTFAIVVISIIAVIGFFKWHRANQDPLTLMANNNRKMWVENHKSELGMDNYFSDDAKEDSFEMFTNPIYSWWSCNIHKDDFSKF